MTYSRAGRTTIGPRCFTAVFGMGTGVVHLGMVTGKLLEYHWFDGADEYHWQLG